MSKHISNVADGRLGIEQVLSAADTAFGGKRADRAFLYNPDAIGQWIFEKHRTDFAPVEEGASVLPMRSVMPSVTPVCFGSMMHRHGPESIEALRAMRENVAAYAELRAAIGAHWRGHRTVLVFAPDHGCHLTAEGKGTHGCDDPSDMHIPHVYRFIGE